MTDGKPKKCNCHPSRLLSYTLYVREPKKNDWIGEVIPCTINYSVKKK